jgi:RNA polymerase sigma-70 factor (ECF subfamily)
MQVAVAERGPLSALFLAGLSAPSREALARLPDLEQKLYLRFSEAQGAWPEFRVIAEVFLPYAAARVDAGDPAGSFEKLRLTDLYVACACVQRDGRAVAALHARHFAEIEAAVARMRLPAAKIDDVKQIVSRTLFVGDASSPPHVVQYSGKGDLRGWLRVTAVRAALKVIRKEKREILVEDDALFEAQAAHVAAADPEMMYVKEVYRAAFKQAFQEALDSLTDREKILVRQHVVDELSIDQLGALYQVHRATAARWVQGARDTLLTRTRKRFMANVKISATECESIMRMVRSQLDVTIRRRLQEVG